MAQMCILHARNERKMKKEKKKSQYKEQAICGHSYSFKQNNSSFHLKNLINEK